MSGEILFLAHRIPFPPDRGDKIRSHHILKALARLAPVHVGTFADGASAEAEAALAALARSFHVASRTRPLALAAVEALASGQPVSLPVFADAGLRRYVDATLARHPIATIYVFSSQMAQYVPADFAGRVVMDFVDVDSAKFEAYAETATPLLRPAHRREARLLGAFEVAAAHRADVSLFVTEDEAALFRSRIDGVPADVRTMGNGIDGARYDPGQIVAAPELEGQGPHIVFIGQMDYPPNVAAALRFAKRMMPSIRRNAPGAQFHVVGRHPTDAVRALDGSNGTRAWGEVADIRPWLAGADLVVAPLEIARGVQNKVLEAMAMGRAVLASPQAATGIAARDGVELAIAGGDEAFAAAALRLIAMPDIRKAMGAAARRFVLERQSWPAMLADLSAFVGLEVVRRAA